jgi:uncharacterized protein DUF3105
LLASAAVSKKLQQKQARRLAEERRKEELRRAARRRNLLTIGIAALVLVAIAALVVSERRAENAPIGVSESEARCSDVMEFNAPPPPRPPSLSYHIEEGSEHEPYNSSPPTNGLHYANPAQTGFYTSALPPEQLVHNLEHGQIVIWYAPDAPAGVKEDIEQIVRDQPNATTASPYEGKLDGNFALTAWPATDEDDEDHSGTGVLQTCDQVSQDVVDEFRRNFQGKSREPVTPTFDG